jgi:hypothetical protein
MKSITVDVTFEDIAYGERADCRRCPIARAVGRHFPEAIEIIAGPSRIDVLFREPVETVTGEKTLMYRGLTPGSAYLFMIRYDADEEVSVFSFPLVLYPHDKHTPPTRVVL